MFHKSLLASLFLLAPLVAVGCLADTTADPGDDGTAIGEKPRGPIGKADLYGQCMEIDIRYCGLKSSGNCYCDDLCEDFGDCCSDYTSACAAKPEPKPSKRNWATSLTMSSACSMAPSAARACSSAPE